VREVSKYITLDTTLAPFLQFLAQRHQLFRLKSKPEPPIKLSIADDRGEEVLLLLLMLDARCPIKLAVFMGVGADSLREGAAVWPKPFPIPPKAVFIMGGVFTGDVPKLTPIKSSLPKVLGEEPLVRPEKSATLSINVLSEPPSIFKRSSDDGRRLLTGLARFDGATPWVEVAGRLAGDTDLLRLGSLGRNLEIFKETPPL